MHQCAIRKDTTLRTLLAAPLLFATLLLACGSDSELIIATTTSVDNSGLLEALIPRYEAETGDNVKVIAVGSGAALALGERGDADALLVHSPEAEQAFMAAGFGVEQARVMTNEFVIVGPEDDPARVAFAPDLVSALLAIVSAEARFVSRGDDSGTHVREQQLWAAAGVERPRGESWYVETGQGMGATLTIAEERGAYTLTDRGTWLAMELADELPELFAGDALLLNVYHVIVVNPERHPGVREEVARRFRAFLLAPETQAEIGRFGVDRFGEPLFTPAAE